MSIMHSLMLVSKFSLGVVILTSFGLSCARFFEKPAPIHSPSISPAALLLDGDSFPANWMVDPCNPERCLTRTYARRTFGRIGIPGSVIEQVFRFDRAEDAEVKFKTVREVDFRPRQLPNIQYTPPSEIFYRNHIADEYYLGCGRDVVLACEAIYRYNSYYIELYFDIDSGKGDGLKIEQIEPILRAIDEKATSVLGIPLPTKTP